jgi:hypothetical protein
VNRNLRNFLRGAARGLIETIPLIVVTLWLWAYFSWRADQCGTLKCDGVEKPVWFNGNCVCMREAKP